MLELSGDPGPLLPPHVRPLPLRRRVADFVRGEPWLVLLAAVTAGVDSAYSVARHVHFASGLDLAIFDQAVWHYSRFEAPFSSIKGENLLGDHFHPLVAILAPLYWVWSDPRMLLIAQSVIVAASIVPVFLFARARLNRPAAYLVAIAYATFWGIQVGVGFDFHEVAFAPLLIACVILFAYQERWSWLWVSTVLLLGVKEDLGLLVAFVGVYLLTRRHFRHGALLVVVGIGWFELATKVLIPHFARGAPYGYWTYGQLGGNLGSAVVTLATHPWRLATIGLAPTQKIRTLAALLGSFLALGVFSRWFLLALPLLAERFLSTDPSMWSTYFHYSLAIAPVLAMSAADGLKNLTTWVRRVRHMSTPVAGAMAAVSIALTFAVGGGNALKWLTGSSFHTDPNQVRAARLALALVPSHAGLATINPILPHASERDQILLITPGMSTPAYLLAPVIKPYTQGQGIYGPQALGQIVTALLKRMTPLHYVDGWVVATRPLSGARPGNGVLTPMTKATARRIQPLAISWARSLALAQAQLHSCVLSVPRELACVEPAAPQLQTTTRPFVRALTRAAVGLSGGCGQLLAFASAAATKLSADLLRPREAASHGTQTRATDAYVSLLGDEHAHDLVGSIQHALILCTPR